MKVWILPHVVSTYSHEDTWSLEKWGQLTCQWILFLCAQSRFAYITYLKLQNTRCTTATKTENAFLNMNHKRSRDVLLFTLVLIKKSLEQNRNNMSFVQHDRMVITHFSLTSVPPTPSSTTSSYCYLFVVMVHWNFANSYVNRYYIGNIPKICPNDKQLKSLR